MEEFLSNPRNFIALEVGAIIITLLLLQLGDKVWARIFVILTCLPSIPLAMSMGIAVATHPDAFMQYLWMPVSIFVTFFILFALTGGFKKRLG